MQGVRRGPPQCPSGSQKPTTTVAWPLKLRAICEKLSLIYKRFSILTAEGQEAVDRVTQMFFLTYPPMLISAGLGITGRRGRKVVFC